MDKFTRRTYRQRAPRRRLRVRARRVGGRPIHSRGKLYPYITNFQIRNPGSESKSPNLKSGQRNNGAGRPESGAVSFRAFGKDRPRVSLSWRSEEHTSELQSRGQLVCRLLLE